MVGGMGSIRDRIPASAGAQDHLGLLRTGAMQFIRDQASAQGLRLPLLQTKKEDMLRIPKEAVIQTLKVKLVEELAKLLESESEQKQFVTLCKRIDASVRSWYSSQFEELLYLYSFFDPVNGPSKLSQQQLPADEVDKLEMTFLQHVMEMFEKSNFTLVGQPEYDLAQRGEYLLTLPIEVDLKRLDTRLWSRFFDEEGQKNMPSYATHYLLFRGGIGTDQTSGFFFTEKAHLLVTKALQWVLWPLLYIWGRIMQRFTNSLAELESGMFPGPTNEESVSESKDELVVKRVSVEDMHISFWNLVTRTTIQEPTFERIILLYRKATTWDCPEALGDRGIYIKHFHNIPMADMELVLPEKKNPGLTAMDTVKMVVSAVAGAGAVVHSQLSHAVNLKVIIAIVTALAGYIFKVYTDYQVARNEYQSLLVKSMYDKSMDNGKSTLLHLCDDVIQQEVKEVILAYFVLLTRGKLSENELDKQCEELLEKEFGEQVNFEVSDAIQKLEHLKIIEKDSDGRFSHQPLSDVLQVMGQTYDEFQDMEADLAK